ncbi:hypothetical protein FQR65_LT02092 [Abscondita terminalis]|nr:hypothetical protein FQR65_LT02092 [Abscondita terminalis]
MTFTINNALRYPGLAETKGLFLSSCIQLAMKILTNSPNHQLAMKILITSSLQSHPTHQLAATSSQIQLSLIHLSLQLITISKPTPKKAQCGLQDPIEIGLWYHGFSLGRIMDRFNVNSIHIYKCSPDTVSFAPVGSVPQSEIVEFWFLFLRDFFIGKVIIISLKICQIRRIMGGEGEESEGGSHYENDSYFVVTESNTESEIVDEEVDEAGSKNDSIFTGGHKGKAGNDTNCLIF